MVENQWIIMSFKPVYADQVLNGLKTCEIRTCFKRIHEDSIVLVYASTPVKTFKGYILVEKVHCPVRYDELSRLIEKYECRIPCDNWLYVEKHYIGSKRLLFFKIKDRVVFKREVKLIDVRKKYPWFTPPRSYTIISREFFDEIVFMATSPS